ncbi:MAG TPA: PRC-barrel domain-containing protein [Vicinamibacterales bacterium]|jgi:sporulation protein YlmC with PRC-barrel domain|nr:PRC-barrel domain-containing protein [Vicinamibacterales bacterium]
MADYNKDLKRFSEMDNVEVAKDDPDIRGWDVTTSDGQDLGEVKDLLVDTRTMKVHAVEVELEGSRFNWNDNRRVVVPVDSLRVNRDDDEVVISGMRKDEIAALPASEASWGLGTDASSRPIASSEPGSYIAPDATRGRAGFDADVHGRSAEDTRGIGAERITRAEEELRAGKERLDASRESGEAGGRSRSERKGGR